MTAFYKERLPVLTVCYRQYFYCRPFRTYFLLRLCDTYRYMLPFSVCDGASTDYYIHTAVNIKKQPLN